MIGVPERPVVVRPLVAKRVVDIYVDDVSRQIAHHPAPSRIAGAEVLTGEAGDGVVLIVVMRDERHGTLLPHSLMIAVDVAEMAPAVLVDHLALQLESMGTFNGLIDEGSVGCIQSLQEWNGS